MNFETLVIDKTATALVVFTVMQLTPDRRAQVASEIREALKGSCKPDIPIVFSENGATLGVINGHEA